MTPVKILMHAYHQAYAPNPDVRQYNHTHCAADLMVMAFFFLMRPGEYCASTSEYTTPFRLCDVELFQGAPRLHLALATVCETHL